MATKAKKTTPASAPKTRKTSASPSFREDKKPAIRARQKQKKTGLSWLRPKFSLASLPKPSVLVEIGLTAAGIALIFFALIAYGQLRFGEQTIFGNGFGDFATRFFGRTASFGLVVVFFCGLYLAVVRRINSKPFSFNWKLFAAFLGVYFYISWVIQRFNVTGHPFQSVEFGGGHGYGHNISVPYSDDGDRGDLLFGALRKTARHGWICWHMPCNVYILV